MAQAAALGVLQGSLELLPVSSSGHLALVPALLGWPYARLGPKVRKSFEVALHLGTAAGLVLALRHEALEELRRLDARRALHALVAFAPPAVAGLAFAAPVEERLGRPRSVALAQVLAGLALGAADARPARRGRRRAGTLDHVLLGLAQAAALVPGVSRSGATLTAARARKLTRPAAMRLSRQTAGPVILGAAMLEGARLAREGLPRGLGGAFAAGAGAAFAASLGSARLIGSVESMRSYRPFAAYRIALGAAALVWSRREAPGPSASMAG